MLICARGQSLSSKRVVGVLLGSWKGKTLDVANSYALPFEEDEKDPSIWYLDHDYLQEMWTMFRKVNGAPAPCARRPRPLTAFCVRAPQRAKRLSAGTTAGLSSARLISPLTR